MIHAAPPLLTDAPALELRRVSMRFADVVALDDVSLAVRPGTVHALLGENGAGKSTLMRIAYGMMRPDAGTVAVAGTPRTLGSPADAIDAGIGMVHQHFTLVAAMTVAENLALGGHGRYSARVARQRVAAVSAVTGFALDPDVVVGRLSVGAQQRVEIAKALVRQARVLVLDEPTGVLAPSEIDELLRWLRDYAARGNAAVLITHKLREALAVADDVSVLRRGRLVLQAPAAEVSTAALTTAMLGDELPGVVPIPRGAGGPGEPVFVAAGLVVVHGDRTPLREASFVVRRGEIVGVAGVDGSGQRELLRVLAGRLSASAGRLQRPAQVGFVPEDRHHDGVLLERSLTENVALRGAGSRRGTMDWAALRERTGALMTTFDVRGRDAGMAMRSLSGGNQQKLVLARELGGGAAPGVVVRGAADDGAAAGRMMDDGIAVEGGAMEGRAVHGAAARGAPPEQQDRPRPPDQHHHSTAPDSLRPPEAIVLENPTRGLDVRATAAVHARLRDAAARGTTIVLHSSDLDEVLALSTRILVLYAGTLRELPPDRDAVGRAMLGLD